MKREEEECEMERKETLKSRERIKFVLQLLESGGGRSWRQVGLERVVLTTIKIERKRI